MSVRWCLVIAGLSAVAAGETVRTELRLADGRNGYVQNGAAALWSELAGRPGLIYREAESAAPLELLPNKQVKRDEGCGGGAYLEYVKEARFELTVAAAGRYQGWARIYLPWPGSWNHEESFDGGTKRRVLDSARWVFGTWLWSRLEDYDLAAGRHTFTLHGFLGGARLDALLFTSDAGFDPSAVSGVPDGGEPGRGAVLTASAQPSAVTRWRRLAVAADLRGGRCEPEVSLDGGRTWRPAPGGDLSAVPAAGDGHDSLQARLNLTAAPDGASPRVSAVAVEYDLPADAEVAVAEQGYRVAFARRTGALAGLTNLRSGVDITPRHLQQPFLGLAVRQPGATEQQVIEPDAITLRGVEETAGGLLLHYTAVEGAIGLDLSVTRGGGELSTWRLKVTNRSALEIIRIDFPMVREAALGDFRDDEAVIPRTGGWRVKSPATDKVWSTTYLGGGSMSWLDLWDASGGLYLVMQDPTLRTTEMGCGPAASRQAADLYFKTHTLVRPGASKERVFQVGLHSGDWHWAADRYREWADTWMKHPDSPAWVKDCDGWVGLMGTPFGAMPGKLEQARREGFEYLQYWAQMADGIDQCCGNFYWPAPALGGAEGFTDGIAQVHARGGKVTGYMNCQTWTRDSYVNESLRRTPRQDLPAEAQALLHPLEWFNQNRLQPLDGRPVGYYAETLGWYIMCPASTGFTDHLKVWMADLYGGRFRTDGVYLDQAGATAAKPCYNLSHGHDDIGAWGMGNVELLRRVRDAGRQHNPDYVVAIEGSGDALGQYADLHLTSGLCTHPEVYHYTFPDHILISGLSNNSPLTLPQRISRAFVNGDRFDARLNDEVIIAAVRLRQRIKAWLYPGRFRDTVGLRVSDERVLARWTLCDQEQDKAIVLTFDNEPAAPGASCSLKLPAGWERPRHLYLFDLEGGVTARAPAVEGGELRFEVPASKMSAGLLLYRTTAARQVDMFQKAAAKGDAGRVEINLVNLGEAGVEVAVEATPEPPLTGRVGTMTVTVPAGGTSVVGFDLGELRGLQQPARHQVTARWPGGSRSGWTEYRPLFLNGRLTIDDDHDGKPDYWHAGGTTSDFEHGIEDGAAYIVGQPKEYQYLIQHVALEPNTKYRFAGWIKRSGQTKQISIAVVEFVGERGIRLHGLGADEKLPANEWQRFETTFTTGAAFRASAVYLYNTNSDLKAWYKDLELE